MPDIYSSIKDQPGTVQERVVEAMTLRAEELEMQAIRDTYLVTLNVPDGARVLEIGCGAGPATRKIAALPGVEHVTGIDPAPVFVEHGKKALEDLPNVTLLEGDARSLDFPDESFEVFLADTVLCHVPEPVTALAETFRVLVPGGQLVIFDGDYATMSMAKGDFDPVQAAVDCAMANYVHDIWFMQRVPAITREAGFNIIRSQGHGYVKITDPKYLFTVIDRGADTIHANGTIGSELATALKAEARRRVEEGQFYGVIMFGSLIAEKPS